MEQPHDYDERKMNPLRITRNAPKRLLPSTVTPVLPDELLTEIFLRLPARLLLSVRSVCRSWRTLISSSQFANYHIQRSITADPSLGGLRFVVYHHTCSYRFGNFSVRCLFENPSKPTEDALFQISGCHQIIGSCNGLMCLREKVGTDYRVMLWNPCTGLTSDLLEIRGYTIWASDFGYDHVNDKYKLVTTLYQEQKSHIIETRIYTFCRNPSMRTIQDVSFRRIYGTLTGLKGVFVPGTATLNWILRHDTRTLDYLLVLSLDLVTETCTQFSLPLNNNQYNKTIFPKLCLLRNCLACCFNHEKIKWSVWVMKEYGVPQSWTKLAIIPYHSYHSSLSSGISDDHLLPLYIWENVIMAAASYSRIVLYNIDNGSFKFPVLEPTSRSYYFGLQVHIYRESLVSPPYLGLRSSSSQIRLIKP